MNPTLDPSTAFIFTLTPADLLRHAALYIEHFGWMTHAYYQRDDHCDSTPAACAMGAIGAAVHGVAHKDPSDEELPGHRTFTTVRNAFADYLLASGATFPGEEAQLLIADWNDHTATDANQVITALKAAADDWSRLHIEEDQ